MSLRRALLAVPAALCACSPGSPAPPQVAAPPPALTASAAAPPSDAGPSADAGLPAPAPAPTRFFPTLSTSSFPAFQLWTLGKALVAVAFIHDHARFAVTEGDDFELRPEMAKGLPVLEDQKLVHLVGRIPGPAWLVMRTIDFPTPEVRIVDDVFRLHEGHWQPVERAPNFQSYGLVWEAPEGCLVGMRGDGEIGGATGAPGATVRAVDCKGRIPLLPGPRRSRLSFGYLFPEARGLPSGDLYMLAAASSAFAAVPPYNLPPLLEIWPHDRGKPSTLPIPLPADVTAGGREVYSKPKSLLVRSPTEVYVAANFVEVVKLPTGQQFVDKDHRHPPFLARFDGAAWSPMDLPPIGGYTDLHLTADGSFLLLGFSRDRWEGPANELWGKRPGGTWENLGPMPVEPGKGKPYVPRAIRGSSLDDVWVVGETQDGKESVVFHNRPARAVVRLDETTTP